jgi:glycosyltransferase involved in cell wall biosynthesis
MLTPDQDSGSVRTWRLLRVMREGGCKVTFVAGNLEHRQPYAGELAQEGVEVLHHPHVDSVEQYIEDHGREFDMIVIARYYVASRYVDVVRRHAPQALLVFDTLDLHFLRTRRLAELEGSRALARNAEAIYRQEMDCIARCDVTWVVSPVEKEVLAREAPNARVVVQTNIHEAAERVAPFAGREGIVFVGGYRHPPNVDAALFYAREVMPHLRRLLPGVTSYLIGSNPPQAIRDLAGEGLEAVGYVPDLAPWFETARLSVSPLRYGAGVKGKVNHAMSFGLPMVATSASVEGMHLTDGEEVLIADAPEAIAEAVARLYRDEALWKRLSAAGLANVRAHFSPEAASRALEATFAYHSREPDPTHKPTEKSP